uniref:DUF4371 domain-containing protein n=1 Tax=Trichuris muris TaxID=70415 RepID=A0A5S6Q6I3_TRIMR
MTGKCDKEHTIGEQLLLPVVKEVLRTVVHSPVVDIAKKIPLSNDTVQRRIDVMAKEMEDTLCSLFREFSLVLDESTLPGNEAILLAYVRFIKDEHLMQECLLAKELKTDAKGHLIFRIVDEYFEEKKIPIKNMLAVATDGAPSMVGCHRGFVAYLKQMVTEVLAIHCVVHRQNLVAKYLSRRLNESLQCAVNRMKSNSLKDRLFRRL